MSAGALRDGCVHQCSSTFLRGPSEECGELLLGGVGVLAVKAAFDQTGVDGIDDDLVLADFGCQLPSPQDVEQLGQIVALGIGPSGLVIHLLNDVGCGLLLEGSPHVNLRGGKGHSRRLAVLGSSLTEGWQEKERQEGGGEMIDLDGGFMTGCVVLLKGLLLQPSVEEDEIETIELLGALAESDDAVEGIHVEGPDLNVAGGVGLQQLSFGFFAFGWGANGHDDAGNLEAHELTSGFHADADIGAGDQDGLAGEIMEGNRSGVSRLLTVHEAEHAHGDGFES